jgi:phage shock protein E
MRRSLHAAMVMSFLFCASTVMAQYLTIGADQIKDLMAGGKKSVLIDVRSAEEYQAGHIPGAVNIPAERIAAEKNRLPKDKAAPLIFCCRGVG